MRKGLTLFLEEREWQELYRILLDEDEAAALQFLKQYLHKPLMQALEGGCKVMLRAPGAGIRMVNGRDMVQRNDIRGGI